MAASSLVAVFIPKMILQATSNYGVENSLAQAAYAIRIIIYDCFDDENILCKAGTKTDVYRYFQLDASAGTGA